MFRESCLNRQVAGVEENRFAQTMLILFLSFLQLSLAYECMNDAFENNDELLNATTIESGVQTMAANLCELSDVDFYRLHVPDLTAGYIELYLAWTESHKPAVNGRVDVAFWVDSVSVRLGFIALHFCCTCTLCKHLVTFFTF